MQKKKFNDDLIKSLPLLRLYALKLTGDAEMAQDLIQEAAVRAISSIDTYVDDKNFSGWLYTIIYHVFVNESHRSSLERFVFSQIDDKFYNSFFSSFDIDSEIAFRELLDLIRSCLSEDYFSVFILFASGYKYREISDILSLPIGTVKSRIYFSRVRLQGVLRDLRFQ